MSVEQVQYVFNTGYYDELLSKLSESNNLLNSVLTKSHQEIDYNRNLATQQYSGKSC